MEKKIFILFTFTIFLLIPFISSVNIEPGTVLNATESDSIISFSTTVNVDSLDVESDYIYLKGISYTYSGTSYSCSSYTHSDGTRINAYEMCMTEDSSDDEDTSTSGGGTPSFWEGTYVLSDKQIKEEFNSEKGFTRALEVKNRMRVKIKSRGGDGEGISEEHHVGVVNISEENETAIIEVSSNPQQAEMSVGDIEKFDVTNDSYYDISVELLDIEDGKANITVKSIYEEIECVPDWSCSEWSDCINETQTRECEDLNECNVSSGKPQETQSCGTEGEPETEEKSYWYFWVLGIVIVGLVVWYFWRKLGVKDLRREVR